jgi:glycerol-3-phosphate dehydrogenase (NAD(P)+)
MAPETATNMSEQTVTILGAGSWGTALAILLARNGKPATLWSHSREHIDNMQRAGCNEHYLPDCPLPSNLSLTDNLADAVMTADDLLVAVPSHAFREVLENVKPLLRPSSRIAWATKGLETKTHQLLHEVATQVLGNAYPLAVISGPTFAREVARGLPTAITVASGNQVFADALADRLHDDRFRAYTTDDIAGVVLGGAVKNVLAIAAGISDGLGFGANARAALITRGLAEMTRLGITIGGHPETFMGLAGLGDLVLTCTDNQSRNRRTGLGIAEGKSLQQIAEEIGQVMEGVQTAGEIHLLAEKHGVDMPICHQVYLILHEGHDAHSAVHELLSRRLKPETS